MPDTLGANECPVCRFDHLSLPVTVACPDHGHRLITARGRMTCPGHRCRYWRPHPDDEQKPGTVSDSQITALAAQGVTCPEALSYNEAGALLVKLWRKAAGEMRQHCGASSASRKSTPSKSPAPGAASASCAASSGPRSSGSSTTTASPRAPRKPGAAPGLSPARRGPGQPHHQGEAYR